MENNLIPPFILREAGLQGKDTPKIHIEDPDTSDHAITFLVHDLRITLQLHGIFSFFHQKILIDKPLEGIDEPVRAMEEDPLDAE